MFLRNRPPLDKVGEDRREGEGKGKGGRRRKKTFRTFDIGKLLFPSRPGANEASSSEEQEEGQRRHRLIATRRRRRVDPPTAVSRN